MFHTQDDIRNNLIEAGIDATIANLLAQQAKPAVWLETHEVDVEAKIPIGATKIGGRPDLPANVAWPVRPAWPDAEEGGVETFRQMVEEYTSEESIQSAREGLEEFAQQFPPEQHQTMLTHMKETLKSIFSPKHRQMMESMAKMVATQEQARQAIMKSAQPLSFVAQINFAELWAAGPLDTDMPRHGVLSIFYDTVAQAWGGNPHDGTGFAILFHDADETLSRREEPDELQRDGDSRFSPVACIPHACMTPLPVDTALYARLELPKKITKRVREWGESGESPLCANTGGEDWQCHRIGGWPTPIQGDMQTDCAFITSDDSVPTTATDWLLLAQIGSDDSKIHMMWGDDGLLYLWIHRNDLKARCFANAWLILQCH